MTSTDPAQQAQRMRTELAYALSQVEDRINVPRRCVRRVRAMARERPAQLVLAGVGTAAVIAGVAWAVVSVRARR